MNETLKSCPCCNGKAEICAGIYLGQSASFVQCQNCGLQTRYYTELLLSPNGLTSAQKKAIEDWNRRIDNGNKED